MPELPDLARMLGLPSGTPNDSCLALVRAYGARRLYVPKRLHPLHRLCQLLGHEHAARLSAARGGEYLAIPQLSGWKRSNRNAILASVRATEGLSHEAIANKYRVSRRTVQRALRQTAAE